LSDRIISRCALGSADPSCDLSTGSGVRAGRFVYVPVSLPSLSLAAGHHSTSVRMPLTLRGQSVLF